MVDIPKSTYFKPHKKVRNLNDEYHECLNFYKWAQTIPVVGENLIKIVNEGKRSIKEGMFLQMIGLKVGIPDYFLPIPTSQFHGLWIEMKTKSEVNKQKRQNQLIWIARLNKLGYYATFAYGWEHASLITRKYLMDM